MTTMIHATGILTLCGLLALPAVASAETPPNIVYILADDLGYGDVGILNPDCKIATPNFDKLGQEGMIFTDAHSSSSVCTPTRYGILTGRYNWRTRLQNSVLGGYSKHLIDEDRLTVGSLLKQHGYDTACVGKWHLGMDWPLKEGGYADSMNDDGWKIDYTKPIHHGPTTAGFDSFYGISASLDMPPYVYIENDRAVTRPTVNASAFGREGPADEKLTPEDVLPDLTKKAVEYLSSRKGQNAPFFLYLPLPAPHTPIAPAKSWQGRSGMNAYADFVMQVDDTVGQVMQALEENGKAENTILILTSDNGCSPRANFDELAQHGHDPSYVFRGHKADIFEGGHRIPFLVRWPARIKPGTSSDQLICLTDLMATCADIMDTELPSDAGEDSVSILPALMGEDEQPLREAVVHHSIRGAFSLRQGHWKLELCPGSGGWSEPKPGTKAVAELPEVQLYDLSADIEEQHNLQAALPEMVERLTALLQSYVDRGRSTPGPERKNDVQIDIRLARDGKKIAAVENNDQSITLTSADVADSVVSADKKDTSEKKSEDTREDQQANAAALKLQPGDHICLVGNELGERMQHHNYWETLLYTQFPKKELVVRNLCFPADEAFHRMRSLNFGTPDEHLTHSKADVILYFFGFNESFQGEAGLGQFTEDMTRLVNETKAKDYSGKGSPRIVLISPIAFENTGDPNLPDGSEHNARLAMHAEALQKVATETGVSYVDLFTPTKQLFETSDERLTLNGAHLNDAGYKKLAPLLNQGLFGGAEYEVDETLPVDSPLKAEIDDKNFHWWHRYRAVNGYSIYGKRGEAGSDGTYRNREVMERERAILDQMCANRDERIWKLAQNEQVAAKCDDSNTLPFIQPKTNVGGEDDPNAKAGKLGSLEYLTAEEQLEHFTLAPGYTIDLVASEEDFPDLANPVALNFDNRGRLWVSTMASYPQWQPKSKLDDKLLIFEDVNGDGRMDKQTVFAGGLHQPTGFELGRGGVFIAQQPDILFLKDTDGDDQADERVRRLVGFDTADSHHGICAFEWGPGGGLYFQEGTFKQSQVESINGPQRLADAGIWRYDPRNEDFEVHVSLAFANPWGHVFDRWGQNFIADASPGFNYWATPISGRVIYPAKHPGGCRDAHRDFVKITDFEPYPTFIDKRVRPTSGCEFVSSENFPPEAQGNFLVNNVIGFRGVLQHTVHDDGSGFGGEEIEPLVYSEDGNFRPVDLQFGPDGALYIVDWHNALIGHLQHNLREPHRDHSHGRIWRVRYADRPLVTPPKIAGEAIPTLLELLKQDNERLRYRVRRELAARETETVIPALQSWVASLDAEDPQHEHHMLEGLWLYQAHNTVNAELLQTLLEAESAQARAAATRVLSFWADRVENPLELVHARINDTHPRVRLEAVRACSVFDDAAAIEVALDVLNHETDTWLEYTLNETMQTLESQ